MRRLPPLSAVRAFEAAARLENFTLAAAELGMSQAAVSYQVKSLEQRVGAALFIRERGRASLSPLGHRILPALSGAFDAIETAFALAREEDEGLLTIATTHTLANTWLAGRLGAFQLLFPDLAVRLRTGNELLDLSRGEADVAIRAGLGNWEGLDARLLMPVDFSPMCAPDFLAGIEQRLGRKVEPADLPSLPLLNPEDDWWETWLDDAGLGSDARPRGRGLRLDNQAEEGRAAMAGRGFVLLTPRLWREELASGRLVQPFAQTSKRGFGYWLVTAPGRMRSVKVKRFCEWLLAEWDS